MSATRHDRSEPDWLRQALVALPDPEPAAPLFERIMHSRARRRRQRRLALTAALGVLGVLGASMAPLLHAPDAPPIETTHAEARPGTDVALLLLDRQLQAAYDRGADDSEIAALWEARAHLLIGDARPVHHQEPHDARILSL
jgi:hypothetical protein